MATEDEDIMRCLSPWLLRAEEVSGADARVAYYLRVKAMQEGLRLGATGDPRGRGGPRCAGVLKALMGTLESDKGRAGLQGAAADGAHVAQFASKVFERADARVRAVRESQVCVCGAEA
jgi:vacuolar protein sorting-associated protein VTA1